MNQIIHSPIKTLKNLTYTILIISILTLILDPSVLLYLFFFDAIWLALFLSYGNRKNRFWLMNSLTIALGSAIAFVLIKLLTGSHIRSMTLPEISLLSLGALEVLIAAGLCSKKAKEPCRLTGQPRLYEERKHDMERIRQYIQEFEILGINAGWGMGKSFLMEHLKEDSLLRERFAVIQIDLLSCDLDAVELILVEELEKLFRQERVYPEHSRQLKNLLGKNEWISLLGELVVGSDTGLSASYEGFRRELDKLNRKVLLIFEDIDRIFQQDTIQKIFAISEKISCENLHVVFQYDSRVLTEKGFERDYLEKYIPYTVNLTEISYEKIVEYQWEDLKMAETPLERDEVSGIGVVVPGQFKAARILGIDMDFRMDFRGTASVRKVRIFLSELKEILLSNEELSRKENVKTVMYVVMMKHFFHSYYEMLCIGESPLESLKLVLNEQEYTLSEILAKFRKPQQESQEEREQRILHFRELLERTENREVWTLLLLLDYELQVGQVERQWEEIVTEPIHSLKRKEKNEKIDRIVWNVLANGTSELTNMENAVRELWQNVLQKTGAAREQAWKKYLDDMNHGRFGKGNKTVFRVGINGFLALFQAMGIVGASGEQWEAFLDFYFSRYQKETEHPAISRDLIAGCNYCDLYDRLVFFRVIRFVNGLEVSGNLNGTKSYQLFFKNYMGAIPMLGYCWRMEYWMFELPGKIEQNLEMAESLMEQLKAELERLRDEQELPYVKEEYEDLVRFVEKNQELIQCESPWSRDDAFRSSDFHSRWHHQEEVDRLRKLRKEQPDRFQAELEKSYREGKLYLPELRAVLKE